MGKQYFWAVVCIWPDGRETLETEHPDCMTPDIDTRAQARDAARAWRDGIWPGLVPKARAVKVQVVNER